MKNADMPAMPVLNGDNEPANMGSEYYSDKNLATGFTKREVMAMHMMASLVATSGYQMREHIAQDAVAATDALLAELEKGQQ
ncbi:MAG: hypothetical protein ACRC9V_06115 [Aeromonas sp.]